LHNRIVPLLANAPAESRFVLSRKTAARGIVVPTLENRKGWGSLGCGGAKAGPTRLFLQIVSLEFSDAA
jgi:hypothetical protein